MARVAWAIIPGISPARDNAINRADSRLVNLKHDCSEGPVYTLTNALTGLGPWVVYWNDGFIQTNTLATNGTVYFARTVYPRIVSV